MSLPLRLLLVLCLGALLLIRPTVADEPTTVLLWPDGAPGALGESDRDRPTLTLYLPAAERATGAAVVICPGGGYGTLAMNHEGHDVARWLNQAGIAGIILKYRVAPYRHPVPLGDVRRAIRYVRANAEKLGIDPARIGVLGFSAGGHLASTAATHFEAGDPAAADPLDRVSSRPDFAVLIYPVISLSAPYTHGGSRRNLLGENPEPRLVELLSNEKQVTPQTPPTFLVHTTEDRAVPPENSLAFYSALRAAGVGAEMHIFEAGPHGFGLAPKDPVLSRWPDLCLAWLAKRGLLHGDKSK